MRRFSIGRLMLVVGFAAGNLAAIRLLMRPPYDIGELLTAILPVADVFLIAVFVVLSRGRSPAGTGGFPSRLMLASGVCLLLSIGAVVFMPRTLGAAFQRVARPIDRYLIAHDMANFGETLSRVWSESVMALVFSTPPLLLAFAAAALPGLFRRTVVPGVEDETEGPAVS